ncbi:BatA domain-containing protein [Algibacter mikhailovii]|uniref:BatA domain-containing protein n=1 Tax=Algibacter mikhailovii TaxID=425498 RepID=UPI002494831F|nr:BatA domain-containing protein [Algibacter mikhailovii]
MQFKHPELLYALFLLLIPIIVHLFHLRKFQKADFTNVAFLKEVTLKTRKSSQIKKWILLFTRLLLLTALVLAFAQPFISKTETFNTPKETVIYLDNSFSMQAKGNQGELFKRAIQDIITHVPKDEVISIFTNNKSFRNTTIDAVKNDLLQLKYTSNKLSNKAAMLQSKSFFSKRQGSLKNLIFVSDFQDDGSDFNFAADSNIQANLVKLQVVNRNNISLDSAFIAERTPTSIYLKVTLRNRGTEVENLPIALYNDNKLIAKTSITVGESSETTFSLPVNQIINGKITIDDNSLQFDNTLYFNINKPSKINVLAINNAKDNYLKRLYASTEFNYTGTPEQQVNYNDIDRQQLIILNELDNIPNPLITSLKQFITKGGSLVIIPSQSINIESYNQLLTNYGGSFLNVNETEKRITTINYSHPLYNSGVFEKQVKNFQYPKVSSYNRFITNNFYSALNFEDGTPFLNSNNNLYVFTAALNQNNSSFKNSPLIVPTLYNIAKNSFKNPEIYYTIGEENAFDVDTKMKLDDVLSLEKNGINIIPRQQYFNSKVTISTSETPSTAGTYSITNKNEHLKNVSFNYSREQSVLAYRDLSAFENASISQSIQDVFNSIKSDTKVDALWKWFVIFALALLIIEMGILKFFK